MSLVLLITKGNKKTYLFDRPHELTCLLGARPCDLADFRVADTLKALRWHGALILNSPNNVAKAGVHDVKLLVHGVDLDVYGFDDVGRLYRRLHGEGFMGSRELLGTFAELCICTGCVD
jgi:hypothetical protein